MNTAEVLHAVLALPPEEREKVALQALDSLDAGMSDEVCATEDEWNEAWAAEIEERLSVAESTIPAQTLIRELRSRRGGTPR